MINILPNIDTSHLDKELIDDFGRIIVKPASFYQNIPQDHLSIWAHFHGVYCLPTTELIDWLSQYIIPNQTIEIGAGVGTIGRALNIPITDSCYMRNNKQVAEYYKLMQQPITNYPTDIIEMNAISAINHYKPKVVIGSWITHRYDMTQHWRGGNEYGIDEQFVLDNVEKYIMIGNEIIHSKKPILELPHKVFKFDWLFSRSQVKPKADVIYVWEPRKN